MLLRPAEVEHPADHVEHVDAHVAHDAVAVFHEGPPPALVRQAVVGPQRGGAGPHFVVEVVGHRLRAAGCRWPACGSSSRPRRGRSCRAGRLLMIFSRASTRCGVLRRCVPTCTTRLCLRAAASIACPSTHIDADRLLAVDVGPGFAGGDHRQGVPVVGRADEDDVEVLLLEHLAVVAVEPRLFFDFCRWATMSAALSSCFLSTSHSETTSTGATWIRRNRSLLPYQPQPMRPTRLGF